MQNTINAAAALTGPIMDLREQMDADSDERLTLLRARTRAIKDAKVDAVANTRALTAVPMAATDGSPAQVVLNAPGGIIMQIGDVAHEQFSQRLRIDRRYYDRMNAEAPELLAQNLNWWLQKTPEDRLLRMLRPAAFDEAAQREMQALGAVLRLRGVLGKGYRTIDDADLVDAVVPEAIAKGLKLVDFSIDERRMHAKFANAPRTVAEIREAYAQKYNLTALQVAQHTRVDGKDISWVHEVLSSGITIRHSEIGFASIGCAFFQRILKCLNDLVDENSIAIRHVGGKHGAGDEDVRYLSDSTQLMENAAMLGRITDAIGKEMDDKQIFEKAHKILAAKVEEVERPAEMPLFEFVGNIGANLGFTQGQTELLKEETVKSVAEEGGEVKFAFVQGITAVARQMTDYDARLDAERVGFAILNDDASKLFKLGRETLKKGAVKIGQ
jgi:hypothetical protein